KQMKKNSTSSVTARAASSALLLISGLGLLLLCTLPLATARTHRQRSAVLPDAIPSTGPNPSSGSVGPAPGGPSATWQQGMPTVVGANVNTESSCVENVTCETFTLTVNGTTAAWAGQKVQVQLNWQSSGNEYDIYIHQGANTNLSGVGANSGALVNSAMAGPGLTNQTAFIDITQWGTGVFTVHVVEDTTPVATDAYTGTAAAVPIIPPGPPAAPQDSGPKIGYENFEAPGLLTQGTALSSGGVTVEYMGRGAGEPSIGSNWLSPANSSVGGVTNFQSDLETLFVYWDESCSPT